MLTKDFIGLVAKSSGLSKKDSEQMLTAMNAIIRENLMAGKAIQILGLGALEIKERKARTIVHPRTGERSVSPSKNQLVFRPAANLKDELKNID
jgi:DNA-binding protein HU-beta